MNGYRSINRLALLAITGLCLGICGCSTSIRFTADTVVAADGGIVRTTKIGASGDTAYDELLSQYDLLPGGNWSESYEEQPSFPNGAPRRVYNRYYTLIRQFESGEDTASDFSRHAQASGAIAANDISLRTRHRWFVDVYDYEETFSDVASFESFASAARVLYRRGVDIMAEEIAAVSRGTLDPSIARDSLNSHFGPSLDRMLSLVRSECVDQAIGMGECSALLEEASAEESLFEAVENEALMLAELEAVFPPPGDLTTAAWVDILAAEALVNFDDRFENYVEDEWLASLEDDFFGAHGFALFERFPFEISISLPGTVISSNADTQVGGVLRWDFTNEDFWLVDRKLRARSHVVHRTRIVVAAALTLAAALLVLLGILSRQQESQPRVPTAHE